FLCHQLDILPIMHVDRNGEHFFFRFARHSPCLFRKCTEIRVDQVVKADPVQPRDLGKDVQWWCSPALFLGGERRLLQPQAFRKSALRLALPRAQESEILIYSVHLLVFSRYSFPGAKIQRQYVPKYTNQAFSGWMEKPDSCR